MKEHALRLKYGDDLLLSIDKYVEKHSINAGALLSGVGCLFKANVRCADGITEIEKNGSFEIISLMGTVSKNGSHIHISFSDENLVTYGGHLKEGCLINTTCEIVFIELSKYNFVRTFDKNTGYDELEITKFEL